MNTPNPKPVRSLAGALVFVASAVSVASCIAAEGVIDLSKLENYADQETPPYIARDNTPPGNPITDAGATLGRVLFYDKRLSRNGTISCASCHQQSNAFGDTAIASTGVAGTTGRHSMRLVNARFSAERRFFWDERAPTLESQTTQPIQDHVEMGFSGTDGDPDFAALVARLSEIEEYRVLFTMVFGSPDISEERVQDALAQFVRSIQSFDSKYDSGRSQVANDGQPFPNFTASENAGKALFLAPPGGGPGGPGRPPGASGAGCAACHQPPEFGIAPNSLNNGVISSIAGATDTTNTRSPSLRDLVGPGGSSNGPFMHDGSRSTLDAVVAHYNTIPGNIPNLDPRLQGGPGGGGQNLGLTAQQRSDLVAFLRTLSGSDVYTNPKWSSPFTVEGALTLIVIPDGAASIVDADGGGKAIRYVVAPNLSYQLETSTDLQTWELVANVAANAGGVIEHPVDFADDRRFHRLAYTPPAGDTTPVP